MHKVAAEQSAAYDLLLLETTQVQTLGAAGHLQLTWTEPHHPIILSLLRPS